MIGRTLDRAIGVVSPRWAVRRMQARQLIERHFSGAEGNRLTAHKRPRNQAADSELLGPFGADAVRAWSRQLVRDNAYAWGVVDTITSSVVGCGIHAQSMIETEEGDDIELVNEARDAAWSEWADVCDINGQLTFAEIQQLAQREIVEAGECLIHLVRTPSKVYKGIARPVPLALEMIDADRLATERDTYKVGRQSGNRIIRGVELDDKGRPVAYWVYPEHPNGPYTTRNMDPERIPAKDILHLFRHDRIGQTRGVGWFAPAMQWIRDLGIYVDNEIQASAVAACFGVAVTTNGEPGGGLMPSTGANSVDSRSNAYEFLEPGMVAYLQPGEEIQSFNPSRPNSSAEAFIRLMLRGIAVGTGLSYEVVARDYSGTSYSSSRTSQLEDRRRFRRWQKYLIQHLCQPVWDAFCDQAAISGHKDFPTTAELLDDRRRVAAVEWQATEWEWVDPQAEQAASQKSIDALQSTYQAELGNRGKNWRQVLYQRAKEERLKRELGLVTPSDAMSAAMLKQGEQAAGGDAAEATAAEPAAPAATGEMMGLSAMQWDRNRRAIRKTLEEFASGEISEQAARVFLSSVGMAQESIDVLIADASDGSVDELPEEQDAVANA